MADLEQERVTALWREAADALEPRRPGWRSFYYCAMNERDAAREECGRLREQLDAARTALAATRLDAENTYKWRERFEERAIRAEAELRKVSAELQAARAALGVVGEQE